MQTVCARLWSPFFNIRDFYIRTVSIKSRNDSETKAVDLVGYRTDQSLRILTAHTDRQTETDIQKERHREDFASSHVNFAFTHV